MKTLMSSAIKLDKNRKGKSIDFTMYRDMIGLWYPKSDNFELIGFSDADFSGYRVERKNTSGTCHFLGHSLVSWHSNKQNSIVLLEARVSDLGRFPFLPCVTAGLCFGPSPFSHTQGFININFPQLQHFGFDGLFTMMAFYSKATYRMGGPIISTVRGVEICLDSKNICRIFDIVSIGLRDLWTSRIHRIGKPSAHSLTVISRVLYHMLCSIFLPRGGHRDEVSHYEAFLIDSILTGKQIHLGVFKDANIDLSKETEFEAPNTYDMYDDQSMGKMKFEKASDGSWPSSEPAFTEPTYTKIPPPQAPLTRNHAPWMDLFAQINSLGTHMKELVVVNDTYFYSMEDCMDQYQAGFTSQFEYLQQRIERIKDLLECQHEKMMAYLRSMFPPLLHQH
ncbi:hypothetical protein AAG906_011055 [Vitis piasezkii]